MQAVSSFSSVYDAFLASCEQHAEATALILHADARSLAYTELQAEVEAKVTELKAHGVSRATLPTRTVGVCLWNTLEFVTVFFALQALGLVPVLISPRLTLPECEQILQNAHCSASISETGVAQLLEQAEPVGESIQVLPPETAVMFYTSGTTGQPKGVMLSHHNVLVNTALNQTAVHSRDTDVFLSASPFSHVFGLINVMLNAVFSGATLVLIPSFQPRLYLEAMTVHQVTVLILVPTMYQLLVACLPNLAYDTAFVRVCHSGAAPMPKALIEQIECLFEAPVQEGYGLSEVTSIATSNPLDGARKPGSIGLPLPGIRVEVVDDENVRVAPGETGQLRIAGDTVMLGYYGQTDKTKARLRDGWVYTGDMGYADDEGYLFLHGRVDDLMNVGGYKVYPKEIEDVLHRHPAVSACAVVAIPNAVFHHEVAAMLVLRAGEIWSSTLQAELQSWCKASLANYKCPRSYHVVESIPQTLSGKVLRFAVAEAVSELLKTVY
jgi:long-chain acyl-CoA synthetase